MTTATLATNRADFARIERTIDGLIERIARKIAERRAYRRTLKTLRAMDMRQREDLGFAGLDLRAIARSGRIPA